MNQISDFVSCYLHVKFEPDLLAICIYWCTIFWPVGIKIWLVPL